MSKLILIFLIIGPMYFGYAQKSKKVDSSAIESFADKFVVKLNIDTQTDTYTITNRQGGNPLIVSPNTNYNVFLSLDYQFLGLSYGFSPNIFSSPNDDLKGESSFSDFRFRAALGHWIQGFQISSIKGYYVENTGDFTPNWTEGVDPYITIPDLKSNIYGMSTSYAFNPNFSFRNVLYNTEWQKKSAGSFIPTLFYSYDVFTYSLNGIKVKEEIYPIRLALAYYYTFVVRNHWFINVNASPSIGMAFSKTKLTNTNNNQKTSEKSTGITRALEGGLQVGYASKKIILGTGFTFDLNGYNSDKFNVVANNKFYGLIYFGYRFNTPKFIDKTYNKFAEKVGL